MTYRTWLIHTITVAPYVGRTGYGDPTYGAQFEVKCRVEDSFQMIRDISGTERVSAHQIASEVAIGLQDRIWLPGRDTSKDNEANLPISVASASRKDGRSLTVYMTFL